jgi:RIO-like serine/threonine protein kinase
MQLTTTSKVDGKPSMVVDYYPIEGSTQFIYKVLKFQGVDTMSTKCITKRDFVRECEERIGMGYEVTGFNTEAVKVNPMAGAC